MPIPPQFTDFSNLHATITFDTVIEPSQQISEISTAISDPVEVFEAVWEKRSVRALVRRIADKHDPVFNAGDLKQEAFLHVWQTVWRKGRVAVSPEAYVLECVRKRLLTILGRIERRRKRFVSMPRLDDVEHDELDGYRRGETLEPPFIDWGALPRVESRLVLREIVAAVRQHTLTSAKRSAAFEDLLQMSGAVDESTMTGTPYSAARKRSDFRLACAKHGLSKKQQEKFRADLRKAFRLCGRDVAPRRRCSGETMFGPPPLAPDGFMRFYTPLPFFDQSRYRYVTAADPAAVVVLKPPT